MQRRRAQLESALLECKLPDVLAAVLKAQRGTGVPEAHRSIMQLLDNDLEPSMPSSASAEDSAGSGE